MSTERGHVQAHIDPGTGELSIGGPLMALITLTLADEGPITLDDETQYRQGDVICLLRPSQALELARQLAELAHSTRTPAGGIW